MHTLNLQEPVARVALCRAPRGLKLKVTEVPHHFVIHRQCEIVPTEKDRSSRVRVPSVDVERVTPFATVGRSHEVEQRVRWTI